jgi:hypothetical protein
MPSMPYNLEKGPYWSVAEAVLNRDAATRVSILEMLRSGEPLLNAETVAWALQSTTLDHGPLNSTEKRIKHGENDFFGGTYDADGNFQPTRDFVWDPTGANVQTGLWANFWGDVEGIIRESAVRAIEVSLGLAPGEDAASASRFWPIQVFWTCPSAYFHADVAWTDGCVTWHLLTPSEGGPVLKTPVNGRGTVVDPDHTGRFGMLHIGHATHEEFVLDSTEASGVGQWAMALGPTIKGSGSVVCVRPSEIDGGVAPEGRKFEAPVLTS